MAKKKQAPQRGPQKGDVEALESAHTEKHVHAIEKQARLSQRCAAAAAF
jgi:hypothetical protein